LKLRRWIFAFAVVPIVSGCVLPGACGQCICSDGQPPKWETEVDFDTAPPVECVATASRGPNVIRWEFSLDSRQSLLCTKTGGDALADSGFDDACVQLPGEYGALTLTLDPADQAYLGSFDFDFAVVCNDVSIRSTHETFDTTKCEC
jgi:hypothetical protein